MRVSYEGGDQGDVPSSAWLVWSRQRAGVTLPASTGYLRVLPATPAVVRRASEREAASRMPAEWQAEVEARRAEQRARAKARHANPAGSLV